MWPVPGLRRPPWPAGIPSGPGRSHSVPGPVVVTVTTGLVLTAPAVRRGFAGVAPFLVIDLGVPRNVDPAVSELPEVQLLNVDDLKQVTEANLDSRRLPLAVSGSVCTGTTGLQREVLDLRPQVPGDVG